MAQEGPSNTSMTHIIPPRIGGELENALETQEPNLFMEPGLNQFRNVDHQEQNYAGISKVSMAAAQGNGNSLGSSSYHVPVMEPNSQVC
ncbi:hypothetical protein Lalb_Chr02g0149371 [Lupinus albus]|uniref:Uncharacterized protein n=1 Tax=Lupinus albus TaxID=3870 RepID=A0A6A4QZC8_LUPAL|nr:hypothetical protein Lalb_Chr02g0149371 [Lupinus albus]